MTNNLHILILAAGQGTRMKSARPKVMHELAGLPMVGHVIKTAESLKPHCITVVVSPKQEEIATFAKPHKTAVQKKQLGTADAVKAGLAEIKAKTGKLLVLYGDGPLYTKQTLSKFLNTFEKSDAGLSFLGMHAKDPTGYGRMVTEGKELTKIVEEKDASTLVKKIDLCWTGVMCADIKKVRDWLPKIKNNNAAKEYYLTSLPEIADKTIYSVCSEEESLGANTRNELAVLEAKIQERLRSQAMTNGATLIDPTSVTFSHDTKIGQDVVIEPNVFFGAGVVIDDNVHIKGFSHIEQAHVKSGAVVGPYARLRPGTVLEQDSKIGNFVEVKNTTIGKGSKVNHLSYIGDTKVGSDSNIGAGTITCNYDGFDKHKSTIGDGVFVGSNSTLISPITLSDGSYIAAGSVITNDVSKDSLAFGRSRQAEKKGWAKTYRQSKKK